MMRRQMLVWVLLTVALVNECCCDEYSEEERFGLLNIKAWIGPSDSFLQGLLENDYCSWSRLKCEKTISNAPRVTEINLWGVGGSKNMVDFHLNASLFLPFKELKGLYLGRNKLPGCFKNHGFEVLSSSLTKLENLDLSLNEFDDDILLSLSGFSSLKLLDLSGNMLTGSVGIKGLRMLEVLYLDNINMTGSILLESLGALPSLKILSVRSSSLNFAKIVNQGLSSFVKLEKLFLDYSFLPTNFLQTIGSLSALKVLSLRNCELIGTVPTQGLCKLKKLEELHLRSNNLEGLLPACLGNLSSLRALDVSHNQLVGSIASGPLTHLTSLETLLISSNQFELPASFKPFMNHSNLKFIDCSDNKLIAAEPAASFQKFFPKFQPEYFILSNCTSGTSQALTTKIRNFLYNQRHLRVLDLSYNGFRGMFPSWLFENNTGLEQIFLKHNSFAGPFLLPFHPHVNLLGLEASNNNIQGQIPTNTCSIFPKLASLVMANNRLTGSIPSCLGNMSRLEYLGLSNNQLSIVQLELLTFSSLYTLVLSNNNLDGQILSFVSNSSASPSLNTFDISNNNFSGMLPRWIGNLTFLSEVDFSNNQFEGPIPQDFCKLQNLGFLDLSQNNLSGFIPSCFSPQISHLLLYKNQFSGPLTPLLYHGSSLVTLDLAYNNFEGSIPNSIGNLSVLSVLVLKANHFHGELPVQLCMLKQLSILDVSQNKLSGPLPSCLGNLTFNTTSGKVFHSPYYFLNQDLHVKDIRDEGVEFTTKRRYDTYKGDILDLMSGIDLSCNKFTGEVPPEIGYLSEIRALNISYNSLTGPIPATFSNLKQIESLDVSYNNLTGAIPQQLTLLTTLEVFSVAHNNLSGKTPEIKNQFGTFEASCYEGNPLLSVTPLLNSCNEAESPSRPVPNDEGEDGFMDMDVFYVTFGVCYLIVVLTIAAVLCINPYWRRRWFYFIECCIESCYYFVLDRWFS